MNADQEHSIEERLMILEKFSQKLIDSGYGQEVCQEILKAGLTRYYRIVLQDAAGNRKLYRSAEEMREGRALKEFKNKSQFKSRRGGQKVIEKLDYPEMEVRKEEQNRKPEERQEKHETNA